MENIADLMKKQQDYENKELDSNIEHCETCGEPIQKIINLFGNPKKVKVVCQCRKKELKEMEEKAEQQDRQMRLDRVMKNSLMDENFKRKTFKSWDRKKGNEKIYNIAKKYSDNFQKMKGENVGLLFHGNPGNGKTYAAVAIANDLLERSIPVVCVSINALLDRIKETYNKWGQEGEDTILKNLANADLLIIDDLGTEFKGEWSVSRVYSIIDSRYRNQLPLIITTNFTMQDLKTRYGDRTHDRILEMCTPVHNDKASLRSEKQQEKSKLLRELLGG